MRIRLLCALVTLPLYAACAIPEPPPGGAEDRTPPTIETTDPADGQAGVGVDSRISIQFSESMRGASVQRLVRFRPAVDIAEVKWSKNFLILRPENALQADTTYVIEVSKGYADAHGVVSKKAFRFAFATSTQIDTGSIAGRVVFRRQPSDKAVVRLFVLPQDSAFAPEAARPDREVATAADGTYQFKNLPTASVRFLLWAFQDQNTNLRYDREREAGEVAPDTVALLTGLPQIEGHNIEIVDPKEPAQVSGRVVNATGADSVTITVTMHAVNDTTPPTYTTRCSAEGTYHFASVIRGRYVLNAFIDFKADSLCGLYPCGADTSAPDSCPEPCLQYPDTLTIDPGEKRTLDEVTLEAAAKEP